MNSLVEFAHEYLCPSPEARDAVSLEEAITELNNEMPLSEK